VPGDLDQRQLDLQRRRPQKTCELRLRPDLVRHQIEEADAHRPDILPHRIGLAHHHDALGLERGAGRQVVGDLYGHGRRSNAQPARAAGQLARSLT